jgi:hypothetical protein
MSPSVPFQTFPLTQMRPCSSRVNSKPESISPAPGRSVARPPVQFSVLVESADDRIVGRAVGGVTGYHHPVAVQQDVPQNVVPTATGHITEGNHAITINAKGCGSFRSTAADTS